jgi:hypothetical protein
LDRLVYLLSGSFGGTLSALFFAAGQTQSHYDHHAAQQIALSKSIMVFREENFSTTGLP